MSKVRVRLLLAVAALAASVGGYWLAQQLDRAGPRLTSGTWLPQPKAVRDFALADTTGSSFTRASLVGAPSLVFFGFTRCPDVCPATLLQLAQVRKAAALPTLRVVFVSVDPQRDTPALLGTYVHAFDPAFLGLTGAARSIAPMAADFGVAVDRVELPGGGSTMDHSAVVFLLDARARVVAVFTPPSEASPPAADLSPGARPLDPDPGSLVSPVDGGVSQIGRLDGSWLVQAKGRAYTLESLLAADLSWAQHFRAGAFATFYLAPFNYHRIHMPLSGRLRAAWYVPGRLFSVDAATTASVPALFARNERVVCVFAQETLAFALVLVGALFVGSIETVWHGEVTPRSLRHGAELPLDESRAPLELEKGAELGRFNMGSTVILLLPQGRSEWLRPLAPGSGVRVGQALARLT